jgi:hypothetical protein
MDVKVGVSLREDQSLRAFQNRVLKRIFGLYRRSSSGCGRLHNEELHNLYTSTDIGLINTRRMRWVGHVARMVQMINAYRILIGKPERKRPLECLGVDQRILLEWILGKEDGKVWTGFI